LADALDTVLTAPSPGVPRSETEDSIRRIARAVLETPPPADEDGVIGAAEAVVAAQDEGLLAAAHRLLSLLRAATRPPAATGQVLVIEDDPAMAGALAAALRAIGCTVSLAYTAADGRAACRDGSVDLIVLDLLLPDEDGRNLLLQLRSDPVTAGIPVLVETCRVGASAKAECFALGAEGYFEKPFDLRVFTSAVSARLQHLVDQAMAARHDPLTGLPNRAAFVEEFERTRRMFPGESRAIAVLDLDHFRWVEENLGREASERLLTRASAHLARALGQAACFARWDADEFIVLFAPGTGAQATQILEQALSALREQDFRESRSQPPIALSFSAGVADVGADVALEDALAAADRLRDMAKMAGRSRIVSSESGSAPPPRRILLAEDDPNIVKLVTRHLAREGFDVLHFPDGASALAAAPGSGAVAVLADIEMPILDGLGLLKGLRQRPELRHVPVMMLTAMGDESYIVRAFELGADDYVLKPFSMREVVVRLRRLLRRPSVTGRS
jgi:diguanylate cyclase (GGDEF)-like protein